MAKVKVLPDIVANKIAAGEVVERPASVVKELVENAVDAGASRIAVDVESGGRRLIRVADNGSGMGREDAMLSIERHATSKITDAEDLEAITTLGFRGEALPSIVSVSKATIDSRRKEDVFGTRLIIIGGVLKNVTDIGLDVGTVIEVKSLFFNIPARRKFLRTEATELRHIKRILYDTAVSSPSISITLTADGRDVFSYRGTTDRHEMMRQIFGASLTNLMVPFESGAEGVEISGFLGKPDAARSSSAHQYIIMNGRPIDSKSIARAIRDGYGHTLVRGMFPSFLLFFETDPGRVDVNVHPTKREVRIHREYTIFQALRESVALTIQSMSAAPNLGVQTDRTVEIGSPGHPVAVYNLPENRWQQDIPRQTALPVEEDKGQTSLNLMSPERPIPEKMPSPPPSSEPLGPLGDSPAFWQLKDKYIITTIKEGAIIIDQHVAHERILFEQVLGYFQGNEASGQQLLFPAVVDFSVTDYDILQPMLSFLNQIGFGIREFGERSVIVDAVPSWFTNENTESILAEYIDEMRMHGRITSGYIEKISAAIACRSAIKAGKPLNQEEMQYLVDRLFATSSPFVCPHGRPVIIKLTLDELDRRFGR